MGVGQIRLGDEIRTRNHPRLGGSTRHLHAWMHYTVTDWLSYVLIPYFFIKGIIHGR